MEGIEEHSGLLKVKTERREVQSACRIEDEADGEGAAFGEILSDPTGQTVAYDRTEKSKIENATPDAGLSDGFPVSEGESLEDRVLDSSEVSSELVDMEGACLEDETGEFTGDCLFQRDGDSCGEFSHNKRANNAMQLRTEEEASCGGEPLPCDEVNDPEKEQSMNIGVTVDRNDSSATEKHGPWMLKHPPKSGFERGKQQWLEQMAEACRFE